MRSGEFKGDPMVGECEHLRSLLRRYTAANKIVSYRMQCQECGTATGFPKKANIDRKYPGAAIPDWDEGIRERYSKQRQESWRAEAEARLAERAAALAEESAQWWAEYNAYLESDSWQQRRAAVLERDGHRCQAGLKGCRGRASQVHHKTYDHVFHEPLFDLVAVCSVCHEFITIQDRQRRTSRAS